MADARPPWTEARQYLKRLQSVRSGGVSATDMEAPCQPELKAKAQLQQAQASLEQSELDLGYTVIKAPISGRIGRTALHHGQSGGPRLGSPLARIVQLEPDPGDLFDERKRLVSR